MSERRIVVGCDGGGTKCHARVAIMEGQTVLQQADATAGPANVNSDFDLALRNVVLATQSAIRSLPPDRVGLPMHMVAALAGSATLEDDSRIEMRLREALPIERVRIVADVAVLFAAAELKGRGVATIVGTGSIAWARDEHGELFRAGGLGHEKGDEGSGHWIGFQAVEAGLLDRPEKSKEPRELARLATQVFDVAASDDRARVIIDQAADHISRLLAAACQNLKTEYSRPLPWVCGGGVAVNQYQWLEQIRARSAASGLFLTAPRLIAEPVLGALKMAAR